MALLRVCAVWDNAVEAFGRPIFVTAMGAAIRSFADEVNRKAEGNAMAAHPGDFELWDLGYFDEEQGTFSPPDGGVRARLGRAVDYLVKE